MFQAEVKVRSPDQESRSSCLGVLGLAWWNGARLKRLFNKTWKSDVYSLDKKQFKFYN